jgi:hypothetical protein
MTELSPFDFAAILLGEELASSTCTESVIVLKGRSAFAALRLISPAERTAAVVWDHATGSQILLCGGTDYVTTEFNRLARSFNAPGRLAKMVRGLRSFAGEMRGQLGTARRLSSGLGNLVARTVQRGLLPAAYQSRIRSR